ncbi:hypothetical protein BDN70DRAFT_421246, partial [Pholiota conissans]
MHPTLLCPTFSNNTTMIVNFIPSPTTRGNSRQPSSIMISTTRNSSPSWSLFATRAHGLWEHRTLFRSSATIKILSILCLLVFLIAVGTPIHTERIFPSAATEYISFLNSVIIPSANALTTLAIDNSELLERALKQRFAKILSGPPGRFLTLHSKTTWSFTRAISMYHIHYVLRSCTRAMTAFWENILHPGWTNTVQKVVRDYSWPRIYTYVRRYVS